MRLAQSSTAGTVGPMTPGPAAPDPQGLLLVLGDQLFDPRLLPAGVPRRAVMAEDRGLCTRYPLHRATIAMFLAAMRAHADELRAAGWTIDYTRIDDDAAWPTSYRDKLAAAVRRSGARRVWHNAVADRSVAAELAAWCGELGVERIELPSPAFLTAPEAFAGWLAGRPSARMADFYTWQRRRLGVLLTPDGGPLGGRWSFDADNRKPLPEGLVPPPLPARSAEPHLPAVRETVLTRFPGHPGDPAAVPVPTTRAGAERWLADFCAQRLPRFGPYEDAMSSSHDVLWHSLLAPLLNLGLLTPRRVLDAVLAAPGVPLNSREGFVRQLIGWREFVKGVDAVWGERQAAANHWGHHRRLSPAWAAAATGIPPLDHALAKAHRLAWTHHIERLMVLGNAFQLCEIAPGEAFRWFLAMHCDGAEWVMGPNVFGMALGSDGGLMMTKPYICGSPYLRRMGGWAKGAWCDELDGLYWRFVAAHADELARNPRTAQAVSTLGRMGGERRERLARAADGALARLTTA
jgi:deoxyribodipyrimidine photolyase-related protein